MAKTLVDHLFINSEFGAPEAERLIALGLREGSPNVHLGQGTANRRFFFRNFMLELIWIDDPSAAGKHEQVRRTRLLERWQDQGACPFGVCFVPEKPNLSSVPFPSWSYHPPYAPDATIQIAASADLREPMWFYTDSVGPADLRRIRATEPIEHRLGLQFLTTVRLVLTSPVQPRAAVARVELAAGPEYLAELTFDHAAAGQLADLRPDLPLILRW